MTSTIDHDLQALASANGAIVLMRADFDALFDALRKAERFIGNASFTPQSMVDEADALLAAIDAALAKVAP